MEKRVLFTALLALLLIFTSISLTLAADLDSTRDSFQNELDKAQDIKEQLSSDESRQAYLKEEWTQFIANSKIGAAMVKIENALKPINPVIKFILGIEFSWSFTFFTILLLWIFFLILFSRIVNIIAIYLVDTASSMFEPLIMLRKFRLAISFLIALILVHANLLLWTSDKITGIVGLSSKFVVQGLIILIIIFLAILILTYSKKIYTLAALKEKAVRLDHAERKANEAARRLKELERESNSPEARTGRKLLEEVGKEIEDGD